ncbi:MAG TPA: hypothetical protein VJ250_01060 [Nitrososphaeraceae archaeon]|nr:hypothetical protein [Nitrososphaeraceae archaeon]
MSEYESDTFRCEICAKEFLTKNDTDKHYLEVHAEEEVNMTE